LIQTRSSDSWTSQEVSQLFIYPDIQAVN
jgi:hypothetical protein